MDLPEERDKRLLLHNPNNPYTGIPFPSETFDRLIRQMRELKKERAAGIDLEKNLLYEKNGYVFTEDELVETIDQMEHDDEYRETMEMLLEEGPELFKTMAIIDYIEENVQ